MNRNRVLSSTATSFLAVLALFLLSTGCTTKNFSLQKVMHQVTSGGGTAETSSVNPTHPPFPNMKEEENGAYRANEALLESMNKMTEELTMSLNKNVSPMQFRVILTTFTNINDFTETNQFGRSASENLMTSLNHAGYNVVETRIAANLLIDTRGEFMLTRQVKELAGSFKANSVLVGTYSHIDNHALGLNIRLVRTSDQQVMGAATKTLSLDDNPQLKAMLKKDVSATEQQNYPVQYNQ